MSKNSKEYKLSAINKCISDYQDYPYIFWLNQVGKSPLIVKYSDKEKHQIYDIEIDSIFDDKTSKVIRVMFTIWGGYLDNCGTTSSILIAPNS
ncbi:hypothetical protein [Microcystis aeruginosa]|nr:hypothetical protein [Microcystis aeruginosa]